ncbi:TPA: hypothetical protein ACPVXI_000036 [Vibrio parahaemolyticus]|nr:hypothetical protein [Vibrio parahaemolyticus]EJG1664686.1 hypothetical protein [Vibrio parahaemolyticus]EJG1683700.1 hypothetical protein [Vibrio parahaemolyticus]EJG1772509.1 hypothetical protein [Vibrio parahaemolyticus]EJG1796814.1 hypothetical protein [Vibrio parahaemolyticus]
MPLKDDVYIEQQKVTLDYIKHVTTLCTGSVVTLALLLEKFFSEPKFSYLILLSFGGFLLSILFLTLAAFGVLRSIKTPQYVTKGIVNFTAVTFVLGGISFLVALSSFGMFSVLNWL